MSRGELHASKWCRGTKKQSIREGEREGRGRNLANQGVTAIYIDKKGKFRPRAGNYITRAKARHSWPLRESILLPLAFMYTNKMA